MFFKFRSKPKVPTFPHPPGWPSPLHNKCSNSRCLYPNPPQAAEGRYDCKGVSSGFYCEGIYYVTRAQVDAVMRKHYEDVQREEESRRMAEAEAEAERQRALKYQQEDARQGARYGSERRRHRGGEYRPEPSLRGVFPTSLPPQQSPIDRRAIQRKHHQIPDPNLYGPGTYEHPRQVPAPQATPMRPQQSYQDGASYSQSHHRYASNASYSSRHAAQPPYTPSLHGRSRVQSRPEAPPRGWI